VAIMLAMLVIGALCQATAWGLRRNRSWARKTGIAACAGLLLGFPWLTLLGAIGLFCLWSLPQVKETTTGDPTLLRRRDSFAFSWILGLLSGVLWLGGMTWLFHFAHTLGSPSSRMGREFWLIVAGGQLLVTTVHEFGHAAAAWAVHFKFKAINIGPLTVTKDPTGHRHVSFDWKRLLGGGGYMASVPTSERSIRVNQILVVFAGPFLSLTAGMALSLLFLNLPGTAWEQNWRIIGIFMVLFLADSILNLVPIGYTDGSLLLHLILWTRKGRELSSAWLAGKDSDEAAALKAQTDFEGEVVRRRRVLEQALPHLAPNSLELAVRYQELGFSELRAKRPAEAEQSLTKSLDIIRACPTAHPLLQANSWMGLHSAYRLDHRPEEARHAYNSAVRAFEAALAGLPAERTVELRTAIARMRVEWREYQAASDEIDHALDTLPRNAKTLLTTGKLLALRAECEFCLGSPDRGYTAAREAQRILRSPEIGQADKGQAIAELGGIGVMYWMVGRLDEALASLIEATQLMEQRGEVNRTARLRLTLAEVLRKAGRLSEAQAALPADQGLTAGVREAFFTQRAQIALRMGQIDAAIADFQEAWSLKKIDPHASAAEIATSQAALAEALLEAQRSDDAEQLARSACDVLAATSHPNASGPLITLAILSRERQPEAASAFLDEALRLISEAPLLKIASRARFLESEAARLDRFGLAFQARQFRAGAEAQWGALGRTPVAAA
jgi:tetratricopeptide (TPR) repeat protein